MTWRGAIRPASLAGVTCSPIPWRVLDTGPGDPAWNMALDAALLEAVSAGASPPTLRLYAWLPPAVSLGRHQPDPDTEALARLAALGAEWVRRPTGGRAVWHGPPVEELTYAIVAPLHGAGLEGSLAASCRRIHAGLAAGLERLGADVTLAPPARRRAPRPTSRVACFATSAPSEVMVGGRKLIGSAQRRARRALLQHGSLPLAGDPARVSFVWPGSIDTGAATTLASALGRRPDPDAVGRALTAGLAAELGVRLEAGALTVCEIRRAERIAARPAFA